MEQLQQKGEEGAGGKQQAGAPPAVFRCGGDIHSYGDRQQRLQTQREPLGGTGKRRRSNLLQGIVA